MCGHMFGRVLLRVLLEVAGMPSGSAGRLPISLPIICVCLGPPVVPIYPLLGEGSPTKINYRRKGTLILTSLLEDLVANVVARSPGKASSP